jgi:hypothetical protein
LTTREPREKRKAIEVAYGIMACSNGGCMMKVLVEETFLTELQEA